MYEIDLDEPVPAAHQQVELADTVCLVDIPLRYSASLMVLNYITKEVVDYCVHNYCAAKRMQVLDTYESTCDH